LKNSIVVIAPHPDDETLGCGGSLLKHQSYDDRKIYWVILTRMTPELGYSTEQIKKRASEIERVATAYSFEDVIQLDFPTTLLDTFPRATIIEKLSNSLNDIKPELVYAPFGFDVHSDHKVSFEATLSCTKSFRAPWVKEVLVYETLSETNFSPPFSGMTFAPNIYVNISEFLNQKLDIAQIYQGEFLPFPFPRSKEALIANAQKRGSESVCEAAEAFMLVKSIR
jgi:N-acetylglucosamine malate deacetylase 1